MKGINMMELKRRIKSHKITGGKTIYTFFCPGCKIIHTVDDTWKFDKNFVAPTISPSILVWKSDQARRCHSFVTGGYIKFLGDCFHELKNKTVELGDPDDD